MNRVYVFMLEFSVDDATELIDGFENRDPAALEIGTKIKGAIESLGEDTFPEGWFRAGLYRLEDEARTTLENIDLVPDEVPDWPSVPLISGDGVSKDGQGITYVSDLEYYR